MREDHLESIKVQNLIKREKEKIDHPRDHEVNEIKKVKNHHEAADTEIETEKEIEIVIEIETKIVIEREKRIKHQGHGQEVSQKNVVNQVKIIKKRRVNRKRNHHHHHQKKM